MGRKLTTFDLGGNLHALLEHCLKLAEEAGLTLTATYIATAQDVLTKEAENQPSSRLSRTIAKSETKRPKADPRA